MASWSGASGDKKKSKSEEDLENLAKGIGAIGAGILGLAAVAGGAYLTYQALKPDNEKRTTERPLPIASSRVGTSGHDARANNWSRSKPVVRPLCYDDSSESDSEDENERYERYGGKSRFDIYQAIDNSRGAVSLQWHCHPEGPVVLDGSITNRISKQLIQSFNNTGANSARAPQNFHHVSSEISKIIRLIESEMNDMQSSSNFRIKTIHASGSCAEGTKVGTADEFDAMAQITCDGVIKFSYSEKTGFVKLISDRQLYYKEGPNRLNFESITEYINGKHVLSPSLVRKWIESRIAKAIHRIYDRYSNLKIRRGFDLKIYSIAGAAGCIEVQLNDVPDAVFLDFVSCIPLSRDPDLFAVTKEPKEGADLNLFRLSFSMIERDYFKIVSGGDQNDMYLVVMMIYRLIKANKNGQVILPSYVLKTALFYYASTEKHSMVWNLNNIGTIYIGYLEFLESSCESGILEHFFLAPSNGHIRRSLGLGEHLSCSMNVLTSSLSPSSIPKLGHWFRRIRNKVLSQQLPFVRQ